MPESVSTQDARDDLAPVPASVYKKRRDALMATIRATHGQALAIVMTAPEVLRNQDAHYPYRFDSSFHYLCGFPEPEAALVLDASANKAILFCREKNEEREIWDGYRYGPAGAQQAFGVDEAYPIAELDNKMAELLANRRALGCAMATDAQADARVRGWLQSVRAKVRTGVDAPNLMFDVHALIHEQRLIKDEHEIAIMRRAAAISAQAHCRAMRTTSPGCTEYQIDAELLHEFRRHGSEFPAYESIVASGPNACVLHYRAGSRVARDGELMLIDAGCELHGYASDITRTYPVNGRFTGPQRAVYEVVLGSQYAAIAATRPGARFTDPHDAAVKVLVQGLLDLGLLQGTLEQCLADGSYRQFYMHRTGHWLGMDVHDVGSYRDPAPADGSEAASRTLQPGMVLTIEPGLYIRPAPNVPEIYWNIGVRIEDDALVTDTGCEILTHGVPKDVDAIEQLMRGA